MHNATDFVQMCHIHLEIMVGGFIDYNQGGNISLDLLPHQGRDCPTLQGCTLSQTRHLPTGLVV